MASVKSVNTDYTLNCGTPPGVGIFTINAQTVFAGNVTYDYPALSTSAFITVAANNTGVITDMGLLAQTGGGTDIANGTFAGLRFDTIANAWQISNSVTSNGAPVSSYANIATTESLVAGSNTQIQYNANNSLGASGNLVFDYANSVLTLSGIEALVNVGGSSPTTPVANVTYIYSNPVEGGGTGLYFVSPETSDELISRSKAIVYSLIF